MQDAAPLLVEWSKTSLYRSIPSVIEHLPTFYGGTTAGSKAVNRRAYNSRSALNRKKLQGGKQKADWVHDISSVARHQISLSPLSLSLFASTSCKSFIAWLERLQEHYRTRDRGSRIGTLT